MRFRILLTAAACVALALQAAPALAAVHPTPGPGSSQRWLHRGLGAPATFRATQLDHCDSAPDGFCGSVNVPLDRAHPKHGSIPIHFTFDPPRSGPWNEAILVTEGGPGLSVTQDPFLPGFYRQIFDPLLETRGLILLDQRGVGLSNAIDCPGLQQNGFNHPYRDTRACGAQLGSASSLYTSADVARDIDAVRNSLGVKKLDFYGGSYAGVDIQAYASRFPSRLRSAVLDSPFTLINFDAFAGSTARQTARTVGLICARSASCAVEPGNGAGDLAWLAARLRQKPVKGSGRDVEGNPHKVTVTEGFLAWHMLQSEGGGFVAQSEVSAAARALRDGDAVPLLRMAAENLGGFDPESPDDATKFSAGHNQARYCSDADFPWDESSSSLATRLRQWFAAARRLPVNTFRPFSKRGWLSPFPTGPVAPDACITWPAPKRNVPRPIPPGAHLPGNVPALVITGDLDQSVPAEESLKVAHAWPHSRVVEIADSGHHTATNVRSDCSDALVANFIAELKPGDTGCARDTTLRFPAVGRFPVHAGDARPASVNPGHGDASTVADRRVATVATAAVTDSFRRGFSGGFSQGAGLRGGTFDFEFGDTSSISTLHGSRFAKDVAVSGNAEYGYESEAIVATISVDGPGGEDGTLHVTGNWFSFHEVTSFVVSGKFGGRTVALRVPAS